VAAIKLKQVDIIYAEHVVFKDKCVFKNNNKNSAYLFNDKNIVMRSVLSSIASAQKGLHGAPWGKAFKKSFLDEYNLRFNPSLPRSQDNEFNFRAIHCAGEVSYLPVEIYGYRESSKSAMTRYRTDSKEIQERYLDEIVDEAKEMGVMSVVSHDIDIITMIKFFDICNTYLLHKDRKEAFMKKMDSIIKVLKEPRYRNALERVQPEDFKGVPKIYIYFLKRDQYLIFCIVHYFRRLIKEL
jgi:hypothetical protein